MIDPRVPAKVGRYEILGFLAAGGMAEVLLGRLQGPSGFERPVVIKRILSHLARQQAFVDMFLDEARIVASIRHPNVVAVHELGTDAEDLFLAMEYLEGESASGLMRRLASKDAYLDPWLAAHIVAEAAAGLHAAHELRDGDGRFAGLVHRDISPQNLFVTYQGAVKVLDFGVAKALDRVTRTEVGQVKGKLEYMAPEQMKSEPIDRRVDVFALGVVLYELATGRRLFKRGSPAQAVRAICEEAIHPPSMVTPSISPVLDRIALRALARDPDDRYATAADLRRDLVKALRDAWKLDATPDEELARLMASTFPDRIAEKAELLRRARAGSEITNVPAAETDESIDIPVVPEGLTLTQTSSVVDTPSARRRSGGLYVAGAVLLAGALVTGAAFYLRRGQSAQVTAPPPSIAPAPSASAVGDVTLHVESSPAGATVRIGGQERGVTPTDVRVPRGDVGIELEVGLAGYESQHEQIVPASDQRVRWSLNPRPAAIPKPTTPASTKPPPTTSGKFTPKPWD